MNDVMKIAKSLEGLLIKRVFGTIKIEAIEEKGWFLSMLLGTLSAILLGNLLTDKDTLSAGGRAIRAGHDF